MGTSAMLLVPIAVFLAITLATWAVLSAVAERPKSAEGRLQRLLDPVAARGEAIKMQATRREQMQAKVTAAANKLGRSLRPSSEVELGKLRLKLVSAGFRHEQATAVFYGLQLLGLLLGIAAAFPPLAMKFGMTQTAYISTAVVAGVGFYLPSLIVNRRRKSRAESIFLALPDALDLMVVCVEAGLGLDAAMRRVTAELAQSSPVLCEEFAISNFQLQMGRRRQDVLRDLGIRTAIDDVRALAAVVIQAEKFGSSISGALRVQSDAMRVRRRQLAEERAAKTSVKIMFPLIFFIFPGIFVVLVGPAGLQIMAMMSAK
jgi:tight adherence protein C